MEDTNKVNGVNPLVKEFGEAERWVNWEKGTKVPHNPVTGQKALINDPKTWSAYKVAKSKDDNVGIVFTEGKDLLGIDIDHCLEKGEIVHESAKQINQLILEADTYVEISPSQTGVHLYLALTEPITLVKNRKGPFEVYTSGRYFTTTGNSLGKEKEVRTVTLQEATSLLGIIDYPWGGKEEIGDVKRSDDNSDEMNLGKDEEILKKMFSAKNGAKMKKLYEGNISEYEDDDSVADMALCSHLAFWTGKNAGQMERLWLGSPLGSREKTQKRKDYRDRTINVAIRLCVDVYDLSKNDEEKKEENKGSQINRLIKIVEEKEVEYFHDEKGESYIAFKLNGNRQVWPCEDSKVSSWLSFLFWENEKTALRTDTMKSMIGLFKSRSQYEGKEYSLNMRVAQMEGELWYDLVDEKWRAIKVDKSGWEIVEKPPIIFKRVVHNKKQIIPVKGGDVKLFLNYVNVKKPEEQLLLIVFLISCFIPNFPHVIAVVYGNHGSAKSSLSTLMKKVVDPSFAKVVSIPKNNKELIQAFTNNYFLFFDNISYISNEVSDILCRIVTGGGFIKRKLYTNNEDIVDDIRRPFGMNGINLVGTRPDLLDRSLLLELDRIEDEDKKTEEELKKNFEKDLPSILGGIFDILVKVLQIEPEIKIKRFTRMADFAKWGAAIAVALGYTQDEFMSIYRVNIESQTQIVIDESPVAVTLVSFMKYKAKWIGTASELLHELNDQRASDTQSLEGMFEKFWPKAPNYLIRRLNELEPSLATKGIIFKKTPKGDRKELKIRNTRVKEEEEM